MLSKKKKTITGSKVAKFSSTSIKPSKARRIIRKYHVLLNQQKTLCDELKITLRSNDEDSNLAQIGAQLSATDTVQFQHGFADTEQQQQQPPPPPPLLLPAAAKARDHLLQQLGRVTCRIADGGGLATYQMASRNGQSTSRGGDSSKRLVQWLLDLDYRKSDARRALEIGSLSSTNAISTCGLFGAVTCIDLNNTNDSRGITKQDFMQRPAPAADAETFHVISCSLVLNFVPTAEGRGAMIRRFPLFLRPDGYLFLVLPLPCINNSRYLDRRHLDAMMQSQGLTCLRYHESSKLCYFLYRRAGGPCIPARRFAKKKLHDGCGMNNFSIVI